MLGGTPSCNLTSSRCTRLPSLANVASPVPTARRPSVHSLYAPALRCLPFPSIPPCPAPSRIHPPRNKSRFETDLTRCWKHEVHLLLAPSFLELPRCKLTPCHTLMTPRTGPSHSSRLRPALTLVRSVDGDYLCPPAPTRPLPYVRVDVDCYWGILTPAPALGQTTRASRPKRARRRWGWGRRYFSFGGRGRICLREPRVRVFRRLEGEEYGDQDEETDGERARVQVGWVWRGRGEMSDVDTILRDGDVRWRQCGPPAERRFSLGSSRARRALRTPGEAVGSLSCSCRAADVGAEVCVDRDGDSKCLRRRCVPEMEVEKRCRPPAYIAVGAKRCGRQEEGSASGSAIGEAVTDASARAMLLVGILCGRLLAPPAAEYGKPEEHREHIPHHAQPPFPRILSFRGGRSTTLPARELYDILLSCRARASGHVASRSCAVRLSPSETCVRDRFRGEWRRSSVHFVMLLSSGGLYGGSRLRLCAFAACTIWYDPRRDGVHPIACCV